MFYILLIVTYLDLWNANKISISISIPMCCIVICGLFSPSTFFHIISWGMFLEKKLLNVKCVNWFSLWLVSKTFLILMTIQQDIIINALASLCEVCIILVRWKWNAFQFFLKILNKYSYIRVHENLSSGSRFVPCGWINLLAPEFFFNFSTPVYKMWIIQEPNTLELWNKLHFEEKKRRILFTF